MHNLNLINKPILYVALCGFASQLEECNIKAAILSTDLSAISAGGLQGEYNSSVFELPPPPSASRSTGALSGALAPITDAPAPISPPINQLQQPIYKEEAKPSQLPQESPPSSHRKDGRRNYNPKKQPPTPEPAPSKFEDPPSDPRKSFPQTVPPVPSTKWVITTDSQWMNRFYFRGQDVLDRVSPDDMDSGLLKNGLDATYFFGKNAIKFGAAHIYSLGQQLPNGYSAEFSPQSNPGFDQLQDFRMARRDRYSEIDLSLSYSREFLNDVFAKDQAFLGTVGLNHYRFSNPQFWNSSAEKNSDGTVKSGGHSIDHTSEWMARLAYIGIGRQSETHSWSFTPSVEWNHDFDAFPGDFLQLNLDGEFTSVPWKMRFAPHVGFGYDLRYTGNTDSWNHIEASLTISRALTKNLALNVIGGYNWSLDDGGRGREGRADSGFVGAVSLSLDLGRYSVNAPPPQESSAGKSAIGKNVLEEGALAGTLFDRKRWSISLGAGYREIDAAFHSGPASVFDSLSLVKRKSDIPFNGGVEGEGDIPGTSYFSGGEVVGGFENYDRQVRFDSTAYTYRQETNAQGFRTDDSDELISPYFKVSYSLLDKPSWAVDIGLQYEFAKGELESALTPVSMSRGFEKSSYYGMIYDFDEALTFDVDDRRVITNPGEYADRLAAVLTGQGLASELADAARNNLPQIVEEQLENEVVRVAGFLQSDLSVRMHEISLPVALTMKLNRRVEISLSAGPTLNLFDTELDTTLSFQELPNLEGGKVLKRNLAFERRGIDFEQTDAGEPKFSGAPASIASTIPASAPRQGAAPSTARPTGQKGALNTSRADLPGRTVAYERATSNDQHVTWGVMGQGTLTFYLDDSQRWFFDVWGRYNYVKPFTVSNALTSAEVDASSWAAGAGLGFRF